MCYVVLDSLVAAGRSDQCTVGQQPGQTIALGYTFSSQSALFAQCVDAEVVLMYVNMEVNWLLISKRQK